MGRSGRDQGRIGAHKECNRALSASIGVVGMGVLGGKNAEAKPEVNRTPIHPHPPEGWSHTPIGVRGEVIHTLTLMTPIGVLG